jgi:type II secretory pathway component GspD/PulD (secretin)
MRIRKLSQMKGADLMTAPSVVSRNGQQAKVEVIRELPLKGGAYDEQINLGVTLDIKPSILKDGRVHLSGKATVRELDVAPHQFEGNSAFAVQSSDVFFDTVVKDGHTIQIICRDKGSVGQRIAFVTPRVIDTAGMPIKKR